MMVALQRGNFNHPAWRLSMSNEDVFLLHHRGGDVTYHLNDFPVHNRSPIMPLDMHKLVSKSALKQRENSPGAKLMADFLKIESKRTALALTRERLGKLFADLHETEQNFIFCVTPGQPSDSDIVNDDFLFNDEDVFWQMKQAGLFSSLLAQSAVFAAEELQQIHDVWQDARLGNFRQARQCVQGILRAAGFQEAQRELGASHAALFDVQARYFEALDQIRVAAAVVYLQRRWRTYLHGAPEADLASTQIFDYQLRIDACLKIQKWFRRRALKWALDADSSLTVQERESAIAAMLFGKVVRSEQQLEAEAAAARGDEPVPALNLKTKKSRAAVPSTALDPGGGEGSTSSAGEDELQVVVPVTAGTVPESLIPGSLGVVELAVGLQDKSKLALKIDDAYYKRIGLAEQGQAAAEPTRYSDDEEEGEGVSDDMSAPSSSDESEDLMEAAEGGSTRKYEQYLSPLGRRRVGAPALPG